MKEYKSDFYDRAYDSTEEYHCHYKDSIYYVHWTQVIKWVKKVVNPKILEVGCGPGQLAEYLKDEGFTNYVGFDFSKKSIELAKQRVNQNFFVGNALEKSSFNVDYNLVICLEVLEHVLEDRKVIENINPGTQIIFSVPNFDAPSHVRWFLSERQVKSRYYQHIDIKKIVRIGGIYMCYGIVNIFTPNLLQRFLKSREEVRMDSIVRRIRHRIKNILKTKALK